MVIEIDTIIRSWELWWYGWSPNWHQRRTQTLLSVSIQLLMSKQNHFQLDRIRFFSKLDFVLEKRDFDLPKSIYTTEIAQIPPPPPTTHWQGFPVPIFQSQWGFSYTGLMWLFLTWECAKRRVCDAIIDVCMYVCMYLCMYVCMGVCVCMYVCIYVCVCMYVCVYVCVCIYVCICMYACMYVYMCVCMYVCMYYIFGLW